MNKKLMFLTVLALAGAGFNDAYAGSKDACVNHKEVVNTDAGNMDFTFVNHIKHPNASHKITRINLDDKTVDLENGLLLKVARAENIRGWEKNRVMLTQNHAVVSTSRYALVNLDLKAAVPVSIEREPTPNSDNLYVKHIDRVKDKVTLSDNKVWVVHSSDRGHLSKLEENDRAVIGVNTGENKDNCPYIIIDTTNKTFVRAALD